MSTITATLRSVKMVPTPIGTDQARTTTARDAHERALLAVDKAISAMKRLALTGDSKAAREARLLAEMLHRVSDPLFQCLTPVCLDGRWVR
jgi:hypothetical protein